MFLEDRSMRTRFLPVQNCPGKLESEHAYLETTADMYIIPEIYNNPCLYKSNTHLQSTA